MSLPDRPALILVLIPRPNPEEIAMDISQHTEAKNKQTRHTACDDDAPHILVIDDDRRIGTLLQRFLGQNGYRVSLADSAESARRKLAAMDFDLLIVDIMMPGESGLELTASLQKTDEVPVLIISARSSVDERIEGLAIGADDYLPKPFDPRELLLRLKSILRRVPKTSTPQTVSFGEFRYNLEHQTLTRSGTVINLTERENALLLRLASKPDQSIPRFHLAESVGWSSERTVDVQINRLRRKLEANPSDPVYLLTARGVGYRLRTHI